MTVCSMQGQLDDSHGTVMSQIIAGGGIIYKILKASPLA